MLLAAIASGLALGGVGTADTGTTLVPATSDTPPPFNTSMIPAALGTTFSTGCAVGSAFMGATSTMGQIGAAMNDPMTAMSSNLGGALGVNSSGPTCGSDQLGTTMGPPSCQLFYQGNSFNPAYYNSEMAQLNQVQAAISCKNAKFAQAENQVQCLSSQETQLTTMIQQQQTMYQNMIQAYQTNLQTIVNYINDRTQQKTAVDNRLGSGPNGQGSSSTQGQGLLAAQASLQNMTNTLDGAKGIPGVKNMLQNIQVATDTLNTNVVQRTIALTHDCFMNNTNIASFQCNPTGPPCSAAQYVVEQYSLGLSLDSNGYQDVNNTILQTQAKTQGQALQTLLNSIFSQSSTNPNAAANAAANASGSTPNSQNSAADNPITVVYTPAQINQQWGQQLASFNTSNFNVYNFVMSNLQKCYVNSTSVVSQEETSQNATSNLYKENQALISSTRTASDTVNAMLDQFSQDYSSALNALTGSNFPIDTSACKAATLQNRLPCLQNLRNNGLGLLTGSSPQSQATLFFQANNPALTLSIPCNGLNGCVTALQNADVNLTAALSQLNQNKTNYVIQANQQIDQYTNALANSLGLASSALQQRMNMLNQTLMDAGLSRLNPSPIQAATFTKDSATGLYNVPTNLLQIVGGRLAPPMPDLTGSGGGGGALSGFSQELQQNQQNEAQLASQVMTEKNQLAQALTNCQAKQMQDQVSSASSIGQQMLTNNCFQNVDWCNSNLSSLSSFVVPNGLNQTDVSSLTSVLNTGVSQCNQTSGNPTFCQEVYNNAQGPSKLWLTNQQLNTPGSANQTSLSNQNMQKCQAFNNANSNALGLGEGSGVNSQALCSGISTNFLNSIAALQNGNGGPTQSGAISGD